MKPHFYLLVNYIQYETQFLSDIKDMKKIKFVAVFLSYLNGLFQIVISDEVTCSNHEYNMALVHLKTCSIQGKCTLDNVRYPIYTSYWRKKHPPLCLPVDKSKMYNFSI